ncbi:polysaccharide biosynthesis/export family protein [uncultured Sulfitobacter sp.]|uniref:polysaccharide biosynthesis/export family protein n=1 Tax=uncultured Sulfitobacter sp. TaxID=191468 RepID=UPI00261EA85A|nr:polysaccharide biosynthesis/export family protein [uncultured Sulfitobacter sp.]
MFGHPNPALLFRVFPCVALCMALSSPAVAQTDESGTSDSGVQPDLATTSGYDFGPMDQIRLRVVIWDNTALAFQDLDVISGTYVVGTDGRVMLPIIGGVAAVGKGADALADDIALALRERLGSRELPSVAIEMAAFGPVFVLGDVARPGEYAFRPGMRAMHLLALAGGYYRLSDAEGGRLELDTLRVAGSLREVEYDLATLRIRKARLEAEATGGESFDLPGGVTHPDGPDALRAILSREREIFDTQRESHALEVESLESSRALLERELTVLRQKLSGIGNQVAIMTEAVGNLETLMGRGLTRSPTLLNSQRALFELEARQLDAENQIFRASQSLQEVERTLTETIQRKIRENLTQLQSINAEIDQMMSRRETQRGVFAITQQASTLIGNTGTDAPVPVFRIARDEAGVFVSETVTPDAMLRPLDTLEISLTKNEASPSN